MSTWGTATAAVVAAAWDVVPPVELARAEVAAAVEPPFATVAEVCDEAPPELVVVVAVVLVFLVAVTASGWTATGVVVDGWAGWGVLTLKTGAAGTTTEVAFVALPASSSFLVRLQADKTASVIATEENRPRWEGDVKYRMPIAHALSKPFEIGQEVWRNR
jgi:hypothetical protein